MVINRIALTSVFSAQCFRKARETATIYRTNHRSVRVLDGSQAKEHTSSAISGSRGCLYPGSVAGSFWIEVAVPGTPSIVAPTAVRPVAMIELWKRDVHKGGFQCSYNDRSMDRPNETAKVWV